MNNLKFATVYGGSNNQSNRDETYRSILGTPNMKGEES